MISKEERIREALTERAGEWFVTNDEQPLDAAESAALVAWLRASPAHVEEFLGVSVIARDLRDACADPELSVERLLARAQAEEDGAVQSFWSRLFAPVRDVRVRRWQTAAVTMAAFAAVSLSLLLWWNLRPSAQLPVPGATATTVHFETRHGEQQTHRLADNSVLHLNSDTAVTVRYSKTERRVTLTSGEADFEVAHEGERAFRVLAGAAEIIDLGTKFDVRLRSAATVVTVVEGRVGVRPATMSGQAVTSNGGQPLRYVELAADQQITIAQGEWPAAPVAVDAHRTTAWLHRQIIFEHAPLERVASEFNRYAPKPIEITTPKLRDLEISGVFSTDDSEEFLAFLRSLDRVQVEVTATRINVSQE